MMNLRIDGELVGRIKRTSDVTVARGVGIVMEAELWDQHDRQWFSVPMRLEMSIPLAMRIAELVPGLEGAFDGPDESEAGHA